MIRKLLAATALIAASGAALAHGSYATSEPSFAFSVGTGPYNGFSMSYSSGPYWGPVVYAPSPVVVVPPPRYRAYGVPPGHMHKHRHRHGGRDYWDDDYGRRGYDRD